MLVLANSKKTILITSLGLCFLGTICAALRIYLKNKNKKTSKENAAKLTDKKLKSNHRTSNGSLVSGSSSTSGKLDRPSSLAYDHNRSNKTNKSSVTASSTSSNKRREKHNNFFVNNDDVKNIPAEELLELGLNYLTQAIRSWETALDSIESAAYMQSQTLALPNDEHADLVYKLRNLVESANKITLNCENKLIKSSQTLQIIQSRLAYKQQLYAEALIRNNSNHTNQNGSDDHNNNRSEEIKIVPSPKQISSPVGSYSSRRYNYLSDDDNESFVSADSDVDWLTEEMLQNIENIDETNVLYEMALSNVNLGGVTYRVSRATLLNCKSEKDFAAKLHVIRLGFDRLLQNSDKRQWFVDMGRSILGKLIQKADKDCTGFYKSYDELIRFVSVESNWKNIKDELATREVYCMNFYDIALDFILLDAFEDLENPPSAITAVIQNSWLSQSFKETALSTAVWSVLKAKRKLLKYSDGFITRFYGINEYLVPVLAWGFLGTSSELNQSCTYLKNQVVEFLTCLFDLNRTRYTNLEELTEDIDTHTTTYLQKMLENI